MKSACFLGLCGFAIVVASCSTTERHIDYAPDKPTGYHCELWTDANGLPHVKAASDLAAYACWGYLHGRDRAFQIDYVRRAARGRLAEILGSGSLPQDFMMRALDLAGRAKRIYETMNETSRATLTAYAQGVNRGLAESTKRGVYELKKLDYLPEPWAPEDSVAVLLLQSFSETQASFWQAGKEDKQAKGFGKHATELFKRDGLPWDVSILKAGEYQTGGAGASRGGAPTDEVTGSNSWVLAPSRGVDGKAWLANDPHLVLTYPSFWYFAHVEGGAVDVVGASLPGMPLVASGSNRHVSWGITDSYMQVGDIAAVPEQAVRDLESIRPTIWFKFGGIRMPYFLKTYALTKEGFPVIPIDGPPGTRLVLRWTGFLITGENLSGFENWAKIRSARELDTMLAALPLPSFNYVFADTSGNVGYRVVGMVPKRDTAPAFGYARMTLKEMASWTMLTPDEMPHAFNPKRGWLVTANNRQWPVGSRYAVGRAYPQGFRAFRIEELLAKRDSYDEPTLAAVQCDSQAIEARFLLPALLAFVDKSAPKWGENEKRALDLLRSWDYETGESCRACVVWERWRDHIYEAEPFDAGALYRAVQSAEAGKWEKTILSSFVSALGDIERYHPGEIPAWRDVHRNYFTHVSRSASFPFTDWIPTPGAGQSVSPGPATWKEGFYAQTSGASERLLVEMANPPVVYYSYPGTSVDSEERDVRAPGSPWRKWRDCKHDRVPFPLDWSTVKATPIDF